MNKIYHFFVFMGIFLFLFSCKVQQEKKTKIKIDHHSTSFLISELTKNEFQFTNLSAKANVQIQNEKKTSFKVNLRVRKDSAIWVSIAPLLGIEVARVLITKDSVLVIDRMKKEYFVGDFNYINKHLGSDLDYQMIEALLTGNSLSFDANEKKIKSSIDRKKSSYYVSTEKKRKVRKEINKDKRKLKEQAQAIWLDPMSYKINDLILCSPDSIGKNGCERSLNGSYTDHREIDGQLFPYHLNFILSSSTSTKIDIVYTKVNSGKTITFPFKIPTKYVQVKN